MNRNRQRRGKGEGTTPRQQNGLFVARISVGLDASGKRIRKMIYADTANQLRLKVAREQQNIANRPHHVGVQSITVSAFLTEWLENDVRVNNRAATYLLREGICRNHIIPHLGDMILTQVTQAHIRGLLQTLRSKGVGARTQQLVHTTLHRMFIIAMRDELLERNVAALVEAPKAPKKEKYILDESQAKKLLEVARGDAYEALYVLALTTGMRQGEIFGLDWADLDLPKAALRVRATLTKDADGKLGRTAPKTESSRRIVDLPEITVAALREHRIRTQGFEGLVFRDSLGGPLRKDNFMRRQFRPLLKKAELPQVTFHTLRHVANSLLLARGANIRLLADRLGHASPRTTSEHYSHVLTGAQREAAQKVDEIFGT